MKHGASILILTSLLALAACGPAEDAPPVSQIGGFYYVVLDAPTAFERGVQHGKALAPVIQEVVERWRGWLGETAQMPADEVISEIMTETGWLAAAEQRTPELVDEIRGIAEASDVDFDTLFVYGAFDETVQYLIANKESIGASDLNGHCTGLGVYGRTDLPTMMGQNNDLPRFYDGAHTVLHIKFPDSDLEILQFTWAGMLANNGMNNRGLGVTINFLPEQADPEGLPQAMIQRMLLHKTSAEEAVQFLRTTGFAAAMNYVIGDPERVVTVETTRDAMWVLEAFEGKPYVAHSNHLIKPERLPDEANHGMSRERLETAIVFLRTDPEGTVLSQLKQIFATPPVCVSDPDAFGVTVQSVVMELDATGPKMHLTNGPPCLEQYAQYTTFEF
jgi:predicted choloylglycine hydrolase